MPERITWPGLYRGFPAAAYHLDPCPEPSFSQSIGKILLERSPAHARLAHPRLCPPPPEEEEDQPAEKYDAKKAIGTAAHSLMIGIGREIAEVPFDSFRSDKAKAARIEAEAAGRQPILTRHLKIARDMVDAALEQLPDEYRVFEDGDGELVLAWQDDGLWCRSMIDWIEPDKLMIWDYKTCSVSVAPHAAGALMASAQWDLQAATIERGLDCLDPDNAGKRRFRFIAQENEPPYALTINELSEGVLAIGRRKLDVALSVWRACLQSGEWPGYPADLCYPELPPWVESRWIEREIAFFARMREGAGPLAPDHIVAG
jgi:hypothetical protein